MSAPKRMMPETAKALERDLANQSVAKSVYCNRVALVGVTDELTALAFGFIGTVSEPDGLSKDFGSFQESVIVNDKALQRLVDAIARSKGMIAGEAAIEAFRIGEARQAAEQADD